MDASTLEGKILLLHSHYGPAPELFTFAQDQGLGVILRERELSPCHLEAAAGLITTTHLDQIGLMGYQSQLEALLDRGGRWFFNGHMLRPLVAGLQNFRPMAGSKQNTLYLTQLNDHPIFAGLDIADFEKIRGVAGFYGRGYNPMPKEARAIIGLGPEKLPIDWEWMRPQGGAIFSHAGNDLGGNGAQEVLIGRILNWVMQGQAK